MIPWIQVYSNLTSHPKTYKLAEILGIKSAFVRPNVVAAGMMVGVWTWAAQNATDGNLSKVSANCISDAAGWTKKADTFMSALIEADFADVAEDGNVYLHDWLEYAALLIDVQKDHKAKTRDRVKRYRERQKQEAMQDTVTHCNVTSNVTGNVTVAPCNAPTKPNHTSISTSIIPSARAREESALPEGGNSPPSEAVLAAAAVWNGRPDPRVNPNMAKVMSFYLDKINPSPSQVSIEELGDFAADIEPDVIIKAMEYALDERKASWSYIRATLQAYRARGIRTMADLVKANEEHDRARQRREDANGKRSNQGRQSKPAEADPIRGFHTE